MTTDRVPDLDALEQTIGGYDDEGRCMENSWSEGECRALIQRIRQLERVRKAADDIPLCQDCMMDRADDLLAALADVDDDR